MLVQVIEALFNDAWYTETFIYNVCSLNVEFKFTVHYDAEIAFLISQLDQYLQWCIYCGGMFVQCGNVCIYLH